MRNLVPAVALTLLLSACTGSTSAPGAPPAAAENLKVTGTILERVDEAPYSYLRLQIDVGTTVWTAVPATSAVETGARITVVDGAAVRDVVARGRRFESVVFGRLKRD